MASAADRFGGRLAQLVERFLYTEDVGGSSPSAPTIISTTLRETLQVTFASSAK